jgi:AcrR family transcriptional regulator
MGHKEYLLEGAKKCLVEIGYAQTTARDIVAASGTNLASIGYHYGSKDALMFHAMIAMIGEWAEKIDAGVQLPSTASSAERFRARWERLISLFAEDRNILVASFEAVGQIERSPELRAIIAGAQEDGRLTLAADFFTIDPSMDQKTVRAVGAAMLAMMTGVMAQWLINPKGAPTAEELTVAMAAMAGMFGKGA